MMYEHEQLSPQESERRQKYERDERINTLLWIGALVCAGAGLACLIAMVAG